MMTQEESTRKKEWGEKRKKITFRNTYNFGNDDKNSFERQVARLPMPYFWPIHHCCQHKVNRTEVPAESFKQLLIL